MSDYQRRYGAFFAGEPWWEMHCALYEGPGSDWEGAGPAMEQMAFALAKARGYDTTQTCARCGLVVDQPTSLGRHQNCDGCEHAQEIEHEQRRARADQERVDREIRYLALTPEERRRVDEENQRQCRLAIHGLIRRDVQ